MTQRFIPVIGLEIHTELATEAKMFCQCDAAWQGFAPNENTCPVCLGLPGALPVPNVKAIEYTIRIAHALGCTINLHTHFDRKHYFYPDLPKGYQISQYDEPVGVNGVVEYQYKDEAGVLQSAKARIHRVHLEEDTGKLIHEGGKSHINFNRSGVPLVEIVTEADFSSSLAVKAFLQELHTIITYLGVSEADMEKGSMRLEPNISLIDTQTQKDLTALPPYKVEVKNINSFNYVKRAIDFEAERQSEILAKRETPAQETRGWDEKKNITFAQRSKEEAHDYRYFPDPDIPPFVFEKEYIEAIKTSLPELPKDVRARYTKTYGLKEQDAQTLIRDRILRKFFEEVLDVISGEKVATITPQVVANLLINKRLATTLSPAEFVQKAGEILKPKEFDAEKLKEAIAKVLDANPKSVADYKSGKTNAIMYLVGQVMREMKGGVDAGVVRESIIESIKV